MSYLRKITHWLFTSLFIFLTQPAAALAQTKNVTHYTVYGFGHAEGDQIQVYDFSELYPDKRPKKIWLARPTQLSVSGGVIHLDEGDKIELQPDGGVGAIEVTQSQTVDILNRRFEAVRFEFEKNQTQKTLIKRLFVRTPFFVQGVKVNLRGDQIIVGPGEVGGSHAIATYRAVNIDESLGQITLSTTGGFSLKNISGKKLKFSHLSKGARYMITIDDEGEVVSSSVLAP